MNTVFINGEYIDAAEAKISVFDRGFLFGDAVYEVLPVYKGRPFFIDRHIERLNSSLEKIRIKTPDYDWKKLIHQLIETNKAGDSQIYIQVTRGNQSLRKHDIPEEITPTIIAFVLNNHFPSAAEKEKGLSAKLVDDIRWERCDIKTTSLLANVLLNDEAVSSGYQTAILVRNNLITEGSTTNVFLVSPDGVIKTPPLTNACLPGITRQLAVELITDLNWTFKEEHFTVQELMKASEVWVSSTTKEIMAVTQINDTLINGGKVGPYWETLNKAYAELIRISNE